MNLLNLIVLIITILIVIILIKHKLISENKYFKKFFGKKDKKIKVFLLGIVLYLILEIIYASCVQNAML